MFIGGTSPTSSLAAFYNSTLPFFKHHFLCYKSFKNGSVMLIKNIGKGIYKKISLFLPCSQSLLSRRQNVAVRWIYITSYLWYAHRTIVGQNWKYSSKTSNFCNWNKFNIIKHFLNFWPNSQVFRNGKNHCIMLNHCCSHIITVEKSF